MTNTKQLYVRLFCTSRLSTSASNSTAESTDEVRDTNLTLSEKLNKIVEQCSSESRSTGNTHASNESRKHFTKELFLKLLRNEQKMSQSYMMP